MTKKTLPEFRGKPLVPKEIRFPEADFLRGEYGKAVLDEYNSRFSKYPAMKVLSYNNQGIVNGSNPFAVVGINSIVKESGLRTANPRDLAEILRTETLDLRGQYEDAALILRSTQGSNSYLAARLLKDVEKREGKNWKFPLMIALSDLELKKDKNSPAGLTFKLLDNSQIIYSNKLIHENNNSMFNETDEDGLPIFKKDGQRTFYTSDDSLARFYLCRVLGSNNDGLRYSYANGRVVLVSAGGARSKI
jgi:hypothetical protein